VSRREIHSWLMDMDGVLISEEHAIDGAERFLTRLREREIPFLVLTPARAHRVVGGRAGVLAGLALGRRGR
jgi:ribonucleotide monophosphatase NagD (HAD superfamily)